MTALAGSPIRVLESFAALHRTTNPYIVQLARALDAHPGTRLLWFSWRRALLGRYDVLHVHWPEQLMGGHKMSGRVVRRLLTALLCLRLAVTRTPVVRTWHNVERPSGLARVDHLLLDALDRLTALRIRLNAQSRLADDRPCVTILHGHYIDWFSGREVAPAQPSQAAFVGLIRAYKGVETLLTAFHGVTDPAARLVVAGRPTGAVIAQRVTELADADARVELRPTFLDDDEFVRVVTSSSLVVLPYPFMHNSGSALAALSLGRPVLVPDNDVNRALAREVGPHWVRLFSGELDAAHLEAALTREPLPAGGPDLTRRGWGDCARAHERAFRLAAARASRERSS